MNAHVYAVSCHFDDCVADCAFDCVSLYRAAATGRCSGAPGAKPEIIACVSAHAAIDKACDLLGLKLVKVRGGGGWFK